MSRRASALVVSPCSAAQRSAALPVATPLVRAYDRGMRGSSYVLFVLLAGACSGTGALGTSSQKQLGATDGETCKYPAGVDVNSSPSGSGCFAGPAGQSCEVSNGATVNADGAVSGGTESCKPLCGASQYELTCMSPVGQIAPDPDSALNCQIIPLPTPSGTLFYCCPCAD
jgi:hypothetical protein